MFRITKQTIKDSIKSVEIELVDTVEEALGIQEEFESKTEYKTHFTAEIACIDNIFNQ